MSQGLRRYLVTPPEYDDIGAVLRELGEGYTYEEVGWDDLASEQALQGCEVLFLNSSEDAIPSRSPWPVPAVIRRFLAGGGSLYVSDCAGNAIGQDDVFVTDSGWPRTRAISFVPDGQRGTLTCDVTDPGLQEALGPTIDLQFASDGWWRAASTGWQFHPTDYLRARGAQDSSNRPLPVVTGFVFPERPMPDQGHVLFTSFHSTGSRSEGERKLRRFLVLRAVLAQAILAADKEAQATSCNPVKHIVETVDPGRKATLTHQSGDEGLAWLLAWPDAGRFRVTVTDPSGRVADQTEGDVSPLRAEGRRAAPGPWRCEIEALSAPYPNFPYALTVATSTLRRARTGAQAAAPTGQRPGQPGPQQAAQPAPAPQPAPQPAPTPEPAAQPPADGARPSPGGVLGWLRRGGKEAAPAEKERPARQAPAATPPAPATQVPAPAPTPGPLWGCYIALDCSHRASDVASKIGQGVGALLRGLQGVAVTGLEPAAAFIECRESQTVLRPLTPLRQFAPVNLACSGALSLREGLAKLLEALDNRPPDLRGKPFVIIVLAMDPIDDVSAEAARLKQMAAQGQINLMSLGVDRGVSDATLAKLGAIALRVHDPHGEDTLRAFEWLTAASSTILSALAGTAGQAVSLPPLPAGVRPVS